MNTKVALWCRFRAIRCWFSVKQSIRQHPKFVHGCYSVSHLIYMVLVAIEGHNWYAIAAAPAAVAYLATWVCKAEAPE